jgi:hypothetical protein
VGMSKRWGWDDTMMGVTLVNTFNVLIRALLTIVQLFFTIFCVSVMIIGWILNNKSELSGETMTSATTLFLLAETTYVITITTLKLSLCLFFLRIMIARRQRYIIFAIAAFSTVFGTAYFFYGLLQCGAPVQAELFWKKRILGQCVQRSSILGMSYTHAIISSATDLLLASLPIPMILKAKINRNEKFIVVGILSIAVTYVGLHDPLHNANYRQWGRRVSYSHQMGHSPCRRTLLPL